MNVLLLMPKDLYILTRFAEACRRQGFSLTIMMVPTPASKRYLVSFINDAYQTVEELPVGADDAETLAPFLKQFNAVVPAGEFSVILGERLSACLGLFHNNLAGLDSYRNKYLMRQAFAEAGVSQPRLLAKFASLAEVDAFDWSSVRFPVIVKPVDLTASLYVRLCNDLQSARQVYQRIFRHSQSLAGVKFLAQGLLEEVALGPEYSVECIVQDRCIVALFSTTKFVSPYPACDEVAHLSGEGFQDELARRQVREAVERIIRAWDLQSAVLHVEYKVSSGEVKVIEAACRIGGDMISELVELRYGVSLEECLVRLRSRLDVFAMLERQPVDEDGCYYGIKYLFSENLASPVPHDVEILRSVRYPGASEAVEGRGFGTEARLGHLLVKSRSLAGIKGFLGEPGAPEPLHGTTRG